MRTDDIAKWMAILMQLSALTALWLGSAPNLVMGLQFATLMLVGLAIQRSLAGRARWRAQHDAQGRELREVMNEFDRQYDGSMELVRDAAANVYRGNLQDSGSAYQSWALSITDTNDANHNGIPDLSDDLVVPPPRRPALGLSRIPDHLVLTVSGEVGRTHSVQQSTNLSSTNWQTLQSLSLTNDPQSVILPLPAQSPTFWRVLAE